VPRSTIPFVPTPFVSRPGRTSPAIMRPL